MQAGMQDEKTIEIVRLESIIHDFVRKSKVFLKIYRRILHNF